MIQTQQRRPALEAGRIEWSFVLAALSIAGALVCAGQVLYWSIVLGAFPFHDTANIWLAGRHLIEGKPVYQGVVGDYLVFVYSPPAAVLSVPFSLLEVHVLSIVDLIAQVLALRYIAGSWKVAGLFAWLPFTSRELVTGNVDLLVAASILASVRGARGSGYVAAALAAVKISPTFAVRARWREFLVGGIVLVALTLPWLELWPQWIDVMLRSTRVDSGTLLPRIPIVLLLLALRRPWATAAGAALATPAIYLGHSWVLLYPAVVLWWEQRVR